MHVSNLLSILLHGLNCLDHRDAPETLATCLTHSFHSLRAARSLSPTRSTVPAWYYVIHVSRLARSCHWRSLRDVELCWSCFHCVQFLCCMLCHGMEYDVHWLGYRQWQNARALDVDHQIVGAIMRAQFALLHPQWHCAWGWSRS